MDANVALRKESVDRNTSCAPVSGGNLQVALRKESVDRNELTSSVSMRSFVALRKESVDRNVIDWAKII